MSYCRFRNTLYDLRDCLNHIDDGDDLSETEMEKRRELIALCKKIADEFQDDVKG